MKFKTCNYSINNSIKKIINNMVTSISANFLNIIVILSIISPTICSAGERFKVKKNVIIDTKTKVIWLRDANTTKTQIKREDALILLSKMDSNKYAGCSDWVFPRDADFDESFNHRYYRPDMKNYNRKNLQRIGFKNVKDYSYFSTGYIDYPRGLRVYGTVNPIDGSDGYSNFAYFWPICRQ